MINTHAAFQLILRTLLLFAVMAGGVLSILGSDGGGGDGDTDGQDVTAPVTVASPPGGNYSAPQQVTLTANEAATVYYTLDGSVPTVGSATTLSGASPVSFQVGAGITSLKFFAIDTAGNQENVKTETYNIDTTAPITVATPPGGDYAQPQKVTLTSNEPATVYYTLDGFIPAVGGDTTHHGPSPVSIQIGEGLTPLQFFAVDAAGNQETVKTETYAIASISGTWIGSYSSELFPETPLSLEMTQIGSSVSGTYTNKAGDYGTINATVIGTVFELTATSTNPDCPGSFVGTGTTTGIVISFTFTGTNCLGTHTNGVGSVTYQVGQVLEYGLNSPSHLLLSGTDLLWSDLSEEPIKKMPVTGGPPVPLTRYLGVPTGMTIQGGDMYWIEYRPEGATSCIPGLSQVLNKSSLDGTTNVQLATGERCSHEKANLVVDNANAYWVTSTASPNEYSIHQIPLDGSPSTVITTTLQPIEAMARDATYLYWVEGRFPEAGVIKRTPLSGGPITDVYTVANGITGNLVVNGSDLIVAEIVYPYPQNYRLLKIPASGGSATVLAELAQDPIPLKIVTNQSTVYWFDGVGIFSVPVSGGAVTPIATPLSPAFDIAVDATSVIWLEGDGVTSSLSAVPLSGGATSTLASGLFMPYGGYLTIGTDKIYLAEGDPQLTWYGRMAELPRTGGAVTPFITGITPTGQPMVTDGTSVYVVNGWRIMKIPGSGGQAETLAHSDFYIEDMATDGTYIYWLEGGPFQPIKRVHVTGGPIDTVTTSSGFVEMLRVDDTYVFWVEGINTMKKIPIGGGTVTTIATVGDVSDFISDGSYVYYSIKGSNTIYRVSVDGGPVETLTSQAVPYLLWRKLAIDASNVYWVDEISLGKVLKTGGDANFIIPGGMQQDTYESGSIAVDATHVFWTESDGGTVKRENK